MRTSHLLKAIFAVGVVASMLNVARAAEVLPWTVSGLSGTQAQSPAEPIRLTVRVGAEDVAGFRIADLGILEQTRRKSLFSKEPRLCMQEPAAAQEKLSCGAVLTVPKVSVIPIWVLPAEGAKVQSAGHFSGPITFVSSNNPTGQTVNVDLYVTTAWHQFFGVVAVLLGAIVAWVISAWGRNRYNRGQLLLPAAFAQQRLTGVAKILEQASAGVGAAQNASKTAAKIATLLRSLSPDALESQRFIPPSIPSPIAGSALRAEDYARFLTGVDAWISVLEEVVERGMAVAWKSTADPALVTTVTRALDDLVTGEAAPAASTVTAEVSKALASLPATTLSRTGGAAARSATQTLPELNVQLAHTGFMIWGGTILVTTLLGAYVLVFTNLGFGLPTDYLLCVFFGLGLPVGASLLQQTSQSVSAALGVTSK